MSDATQTTQSDNPNVPLDSTSALPAEPTKKTYGFSDEHVTVLEERGIRLDVAKAGGLESHYATDVHEREWREKYNLGRDPGQLEALEGAHLYPVPHLRITYQRGPDRDPSRPYWRVRYDTTEFDIRTADPSGLKEIDTATCPRYQTKPGMGVLPYLPMLMHSWFRTRADRKDKPNGNALFVSEGPLKCLSLYSHGFPGIGLGGVLAGAHDPSKALKGLGQIMAHPELKRLHWEGLLAYTVFDAGQVWNPSVALGVAYAWRALSGLGATVRTVTLPAVEGARGKAKDQGPDDFLAAHGKAAFQLLVDAAYPTDPLERVRALVTATQQASPRAIAEAARLEADQQAALATAWSAKDGEADACVLQASAKTSADAATRLEQFAKIEAGKAKAKEDKVKLHSALRALCKDLVFLACLSKLTKVELADITAASDNVLKPSLLTGAIKGFGRQLSEAQRSKRAAMDDTATADRDPKLQADVSREWQNDAAVVLNNLPPVVRHGDDWHVFDVTHFAPFKPGKMQAVVRDVANRMWRLDASGIEQPYRPDTKIDKELIAAINAHPGIRHETLMEPSWIDRDGLGVAWPNVDLQDLIHFRNGVLHVPSMQLYPPNPRIWITWTLGVDYVAEPIATPEYDRFLACQWGDDPASVDLWHEWLGYCMSARFDFHKIMNFKGPKRSGKGTLADMMQAILVLNQGIGQFTVADLEGDFGLMPFRSRRAMVDRDARFSGGYCPRTISALLKMSGGDHTSANVKRKDFVDIPPIKLTLNSNAPLRILDTTGALPSRFVFLRHEISYFGKEDETIKAKLLAEIGGITQRAIEGLRRLLARGRFTQPSYHDEMLAEVADLSNPTRAFFRTQCAVGPELFVRCNDLHAASLSQAVKAKEGHLSREQFGIVLRGYMADEGYVFEHARRRIHGRPEWCYTGIALARDALEASLSDRQNLASWIGKPERRAGQVGGVDIYEPWPAQHYVLADIMEHALRIPRGQQPQHERRVAMALEAMGHDVDDEGRYWVPGHVPGTLHQLPVPVPAQRVPPVVADAEVDSVLMEAGVAPAMARKGGTLHRLPLAVVADLIANRAGPDEIDEVLAEAGLAAAMPRSGSANDVGVDDLSDDVLEMLASLS